MLSPADMLVVGVAALLFFGPDQLPKVARRAGQVVRDVQATSASFIHEMERAADEPDHRAPYVPPEPYAPEPPTVPIDPPSRAAPDHAWQVTADLEPHAAIDRDAAPTNRVHATTDHEPTTSNGETHATAGHAEPKSSQTDGGSTENPPRSKPGSL